MKSFTGKTFNMEIHQNTLIHFLIANVQKWVLGLKAWNILNVSSISIKELSRENVPSFFPTSPLSVKKIFFDVPH